MIKKLIVATCLLWCLLLRSKAEPVLAEDNWWVYDEMGVISEETETFVSTLNEVVFPTYGKKPQLGIMVIEELPYGYTMDSFKLDAFNELGVGTKEENCGMLFIFAINDRQYGLEIGEGFGRGTVLRQDLESDFITEDMKNLLREGNYDAVVYQVAEYLGKVMKDEEDGVYVWREQERLLQRQEQERVEAARQAAMEEKMLGFMRIVVAIFMFMIVLLVLCIVGYFIVHGIMKINKRKKLPGLIEDNYRYVRLTGKSFDEAEDYINEYYDEYELAEVKNYFVNIMYSLYLVSARELISVMSLRGTVTVYMDHVKQINTMEAFRDLNIVELETIVREVNDEIDRNEITNQKNYTQIHEYVLSKQRELMEHGVSAEEMEEKLRGSCVNGILLLMEQLELSYTEILKEICFQQDYDRFLEENKDVINKEYFRNKDFYNSLKSSGEYKENYTLHNTAWMYPWLLLHMQNNQKRAEERLEYQRRELARVEESNRNSSSNSISFGSGFGGGFSSGGGFKGGW